MSDIVKLDVEARPGVGKGAARASRRAGYVPGIVYGGKTAATPIQIKLNVLLKILKAGGFYTTTFDVVVDGKAQRAIPKDVQRDLLNGMPTHVDFMRLSKDSVVHVDVPVQFLNEETCVGLKKGGVLNVVRHEVELIVPAGAIPDHITVDIANFEIGDAIKISAFTLPEGAKPAITDRDFTVATIAAPTVSKADDAEDAAAAEA